MVAAVCLAAGVKLFRGYPVVCEDYHKGISIMLKHDDGHIFGPTLRHCG
jgi:hypothetical protein